MRLSNNINCGFTLAEVLITLGIIGIVAAMTLPAVISRTQNKELESQFKKVYAELNQVAQLFKKDNEITVSEYAQQHGTPNTIKLLMNYYKGAKKIDDTTYNSKDEEGNIQGTRYNLYALDGTKILMGPCDDSGFYSEVGGRIYSFVTDRVEAGIDGPVVCVDINGMKGPNKYGYDLHVFYFTTNGFIFPMGQPHKDTAKNGAVGDHMSSNFFVTGTNYCKSSSNVANQAACAYYAIQDKNPQGEGNYWQDFLGRNR